MATLLLHRRDLAQKANAHKVLTTGVLYAGTYQGVPSGSDAARRIVSSDLASQTLAGTAAGLPSSHYDFQWLYVPTTAEQRRVVKNGYSAYNLASSVLTGQAGGADSLVVGYLTGDRALAATLPANAAVEVTSRFPVLSYENVPGLHWAIAEALDVIHWPFKLAITATANTRRYDLASLAPWCKRPEQLIRVFRPDPDNGDGPDVMPGKSWIEPDGEHVYLHIPETLNAGQIFSAQLRRPAKTWVLVKRTARASVTVTTGAVAAVTLVDGGVGYSGTATATFGGAGSGASVTVTVANGAVTGFSGLVGGSGYVQATTTVTISAPTTTTWTTSTVGPVNDEDEVLPDVDRVTAVAYWQLALRMSRKGPLPERAAWTEEEKAAAEAAAPYVMWQNEPITPKPRQPLFFPMGSPGRRRGVRLVTSGARRWR